MALIPFKASMVKKALERSSKQLISIRYDGDDISTLQPKSNLLSNIRWFLFPVLFVICCWSLVLSPKSVILENIPALWNVGEVKNIIDIVKPGPGTRVEAFKLGILFERFIL